MNKQTTKPRQQGTYGLPGRKANEIANVISKVSGPPNTENAEEDSQTREIKQDICSTILSSTLLLVMGLTTRATVLEQTRINYINRLTPAPPGTSAMLDVLNGDIAQQLKNSYENFPMNLESYSHQKRSKTATSIEKTNKVPLVYNRMEGKKLSYNYKLSDPKATSDNLRSQSLNLQMVEIDVDTKIKLSLRETLDNTQRTAMRSSKQIMKLNLEIQNNEDKHYFQQNHLKSKIHGVSTDGFSVFLRKAYKNRQALWETWSKVRKQNVQPVCLTDFKNTEKC